jgi:hypothetical protein
MPFTDVLRMAPKLAIGFGGPPPCSPVAYPLTFNKLKFQGFLADNMPIGTELLIAAGRHKGDRNG